MTQPMTDSEKLAAIRALRADVNPDGSAWLDAADVAEVLDAPSVPAAQPHDADLREALGDELRSAYGVTPTDATLDAILAVVRPAPPALDLGVVRRILTDALPADPKWVGWVEGRIEEIAAVTPSAGVVLTHRDAQTALGWYADAFRDGETPAGYDRDLAQKLGEAFR